MKTSEPLNQHDNFRIAINRLHPTHVRRVRRRALWLWLLALIGIAVWVWLMNRIGAI